VQGAALTCAPRPADAQLVNGLSPLGQASTYDREPSPDWAWPTPRRIGATVVLTAVGALWFSFPLWAFALFAVAAVLVQSLRTWPRTRRLAWSVLVAAFIAEATVPFTWDGRFAAAFLLIAPFVSYVGSALETI
jgi:hypothetical protein